MTVTPIPAPSAREMLLHLVWLTLPARNTAPELRVELAWGDPDRGPDHSRTYGMGELRSAAEFGAWLNGKGCNVYVGVTLKSADAAQRGRVGADKAALATCLPIDVDKLFVATADRLATLVKPQLVVLTGRMPEPRGQLFVRIRQTSDLATWASVHERLVRKCGGDENALGCGRLMRLAGSLSYPSAKKIERGYVVERTLAHFVPAPEYLITDLITALPAPPAPKLALAPPNIFAGGGARRANPPLSAVEAALWNLPDAYAEEQRLWIKVGFALFDFDQGACGLGLWERFSRRCPEKAADADFPKAWASFHRPYTGRRITIRWLLRKARQPSLGA